MGTKSQNTRYHNPYTNLAYAIILSGERCNDTRFLNSDWCDTLRTMCKLDDEMYGHRNIETRGRQYVSSAKVSMEVDS
jgi:protein gp37